MSDKVTFQTQDGGYAPSEVDAFVELILENYEELLAHYQTQSDELEKINAKLAATDKKLKEAKTHEVKAPVGPAPVEPDHNAQALEMLNETSKVVAASKAQARAKITALIDQASLHAYRLEDAAKNMKAELEKMYAALDEQL